MNNLEVIIKNWKQILIGTLMLIGILSSVYLVQNRQIFRSKASSNISDGLKITNDAGQELQAIEENTFQTDADHINVSIKNLQELITP